MKSLNKVFKIQIKCIKTKATFFHRCCLEILVQIKIQKQTDARWLLYESPHLREPKLPPFKSLGVSQACQPGLSRFNDLEVCQLISSPDLAAVRSLEAEQHLNPVEMNGTAEYHQSNDGISLLSKSIIWDRNRAEDFPGISII